MNGAPKHKISFAGFELDAAHRRLKRGVEEVHLNPKAFDVLVFLAENAGRVVSKDEILSVVWDGQFVEEANLAVQISTLRKALNAKKETPQLLVTIPGKGYKFVADVETDEEIVIENHQFSRLVIEKNDDAEVAKTDQFSKPPRSSFFSAPAKTFAAVAIFLTVGAALTIWFGRGERAQTADLKPPKFSRLTTSGKVSGVALTPDGRYVVFAQKENGGESLWLRQIETGSQTRISPPQDLEYLGLSVSPDGNFVYTPVFRDNRTAVPFWKIPVLGGAPQEIPGIEVSSSVSFSPDGKHFAYIESHQPETHLKIADTNGANARILLRADYDRRAFSFWKSNPVAWSPDGNKIAVGIEERSAEGMRAGILLVDPADASERILAVPQWAYVDDLAWLDAENLVFNAHEDEWSNEIHTVSRQTGEIRRITDDLQNYRWLSTVGKNLLTVQSNAVSSLYVADFSETVKKLQPREIFRESGYISNVVWSRDGAILYSSRSTGEPEIWRIEADGTNPAQLTSGAHINFGLAVSPADGSLVFSSYRKGNFALWSADASGKDLRPLTMGNDHITPDISADGKIVFQSMGQKIWRISGADQTPVELRSGLKPALSPDGRQTAFFMIDEKKWRIGLISTESGEMLKKFDLPTVVNQRLMRWHPSGKFLTLFYEVGENLNLLLLPTGGGDPQIIEGLVKGAVNSFSWSADGKKILFSLTTETTDAVLLNDF